MEHQTNQYISLANKYRPQTFEDMVGQESISKTLQNALKQGRIGHAYLFYGPRGCGKTTTARILAKALNCSGNGNDKPTPNPCGKCPQCLEIAQSGDLDVLELDAASNTQVEKVREAIIDTVSLAASRDRFKVFILDEVHMLSDSSFNALLKTIEEPPSHVVFILATTEKHKVPATIVSRCQTFRFRPLTAEEISEHLTELAEAENIDLTPSAAKLIAKNAGGAMRDALTLLDRAIAYCGNRVDEKSVGDMLGLTPEELIKQALDALVHQNADQLHGVFVTLEAEGFDANSFLKDVKNALSDSFYFVIGHGGEPFVGAKEVLSGISSGLLAQLSRKINKLVEEVKFSDSPLISAEVGLFTVMESVLDIEGFVRRLEALEKGAPISEGLSSQATVSPIAKKSSPIPTRSVKAVPQSVPVQPQTQIQKTMVQNGPLTDQQVWDKMLVQFRKNPFVHEVMVVSRVSFGTGDVWQLSFPEGREYYRFPIQSKLEELSEAASRLASRPIKIVVEEEKPQVVKPSPVQNQPSQGTEKKETPIVRKSVKSETKKEVISTEKPLIKGDFSADVSPKAVEKTRTTPRKTVPAEQAPEEVKGILEMFSGELLSQNDEEF